MQIIAVIFSFILLAFPHAARGSNTSVINVGVVGAMVGDIGDVLLAGIDGLKVAFSEANANGGIGGRSLQIIKLNTNDNEATAPALIDNAMANASTKMDVLALTPGRGHVNAIIPSLAQHDLLMVSPVTGDRQDFETFNEHLAILAPIPDSEVEALIRNLVLVKGVKRIAVATTRDGVFGNDLLPYIRRLLGEFGLEIVYQFVLENPTRTYAVPTPSTQTQLNEAALVRPQALLLLGYLYAETGYFLLSYVLQFTDSHVALPGLLYVLSVMVYKNLPSYMIREDRVIATQYTPLPTDTSFAAIQALRTSYTSAASKLTYTLARYDADSAIGPFFTAGYLVGRTIVSILSRVGTDTMSPREVLNEAFSSRVFQIDDWQFGPFSNTPCYTSVHDTACQCNAGSRQVLLGKMTKSLTLVPIPEGAVRFSLDQCIQSKTIQSPLIQLVAMPHASNLTAAVGPLVTAAVSDFVAGESAGYTNVTTSPSSRTGIIVGLNFTSLAALATAQEDKLLTVAIGGVYNESIEASAANLTAVLDPLYVIPRLYGGYTPRVVHLTTTLEQEIHALSSVYGAVRVLTADRASLAGLTTAFTRSANTFGLHPGAVSLVATIADGLGPMTGGAVFLHGLASEADVTAINAFLERSPSSMVLLPFQHVSLWYGVLLSTITDADRLSRVVYATNLPNWNPSTTGTAASTSLMASYYASVRESNLRSSPRSLLGFLTQRLVANIVERIPSKLTQDTFLATLYAVSVVVLDPNAFSVGPLSSASCSTANGVSSVCETNVGARSVQVRSLAAAVSASPSVSSSVAGSFVFSSGAIDYQPLPKEKGMDTAVIVAVLLGAAVVVALVVSFIVMKFCTGRSHTHAPKDLAKPFTIIFTDIQSSTSLWAEVPDAMAAALEVHHRLIRQLIKRHRGYEVKTIGDAFMIAFKNADDAVKLACELQFVFFRCAEFPASIDQAYLSFDREKIMECDEKEEIANLSANLSPEAYALVWSGLRVRVGIHTAYGDIKKDEVTQAYDYYGTVTNTAARVESVCHGGQVCFTEGTLKELTMPMQTYESQLPVATTEIPCMALLMGNVELRGLTDKVTMYQLECVAGRVFPPLRLDHAEEDELLVEEEGENHCTNDTVSECGTLQSTVDGAGGAPLSFPSDIHSVQFVASIATLFSVLPADKRAKEMKRMCDLWRIRVDKKAVDKAAGWTTAAWKAKYGQRQATDETATRWFTLMLAKDDLQQAVFLDSLVRRVKGISNKALASAVMAIQGPTDLFFVEKGRESRKPSVHDTRSVGTSKIQYASKTGASSDVYSFSVQNSDTDAISPLRSNVVIRPIPAEVVKSNQNPVLSPSDGPLSE